jgi:uncharacterized repeat protein (TIGR03803 family)
LIASLLIISLTIVLPSSAQTNFQVLYSFRGGTDGASPFSSVVRDGAGNLYGTTTYGGTIGCGNGSTGCGVVFSLDSTGNESILHAFTAGTDGESPFGGLALDSSGNLYGTTFLGGSGSCKGHLCGTVFKVDSSSNETVLYRFTGLSGDGPMGGVVRDGVGNLYGTTSYGGFYRFGNVFRLDTARRVKALHTFQGGNDGVSPNAGVLRDGAGVLFGTTSIGGTAGMGTLFKVDSAGSESVLYSFAGGTDGAYPQSSLIQDAAGNLYGTTLDGGVNSRGTVYRVSAQGIETVLYSFSGGADGGGPYANLLRDSSGNLYGTAPNGGDLSCNPPYGCGVIFKLDATGRETVLYAFTGGSDGAFPYAALIRDSEGNLYGTANSGGDLSCNLPFGCGTVFKVSH